MARAEALRGIVLLDGRQLDLSHRIGCGAYGDVYACSDLATQEEFALKLEKSSNPEDRLQLENEFDVYTKLRGAGCVPRLFGFGDTVIGGEGYRGLLLELLGPSLPRLLHLCDRFSYQTTSRLAAQMISCVEEVHTRGLIHRDIKPDNFAVSQDGERVYIIDFGSAVPYRSHTGVHIPFEKTNQIVGTARYVSVNVHQGYVQSRRDDLIALAYVCVYLIRGRLPWQGRAGNLSPPETMKVLSSLKKGTTANELCEGLPGSFAAFTDYANGLAFDATPDYAHCLDLFENLYPLEAGDAAFDWLAGRHTDAFLMMMRPNDERRNFKRNRRNQRASQIPPSKVERTPPRALTTRYGPPVRRNRPQRLRPPTRARNDVWLEEELERTAPRQTNMRRSSSYRESRQSRNFSKPTSAFGFGRGSGDALHLRGQFPSKRRLSSSLPSIGFAAAGSHTQRAALPELAPN